MKKSIIFLSFLVCMGCQMTMPVQDTENTNMATGSGEVLSISAEGNRNIDMFGGLAELSVDTAEVAYTDTAKGFLAKPKEQGTYPAVIIVHEWWGLNQSIKDMAKLLANEGYVVFAVDLYDGAVATEASEAGQMARGVRTDVEKAVDNMKSAEIYVRSLAEVNPTKLAVLGWCFGGEQALNFSLASTDLSATVIYYGNLITDKTELAKITWPVLGIFGEVDTSIPVSTVEEFRSALDDLSITNEIYMYPRVGHAFANPSGERYAPAETLDAWQKTLDFLAKNLT